MGMLLALTGPSKFIIPTLQRVWSGYRVQSSFPVKYVMNSVFGSLRMGGKAVDQKSKVITLHWYSPLPWPVSQISFFISVCTVLTILLRSQYMKANFLALVMGESQMAKCTMRNPSAVCRYGRMASLKLGTDLQYISRHEVLRVVGYQTDMMQGPLIRAQLWIKQSEKQSKLEMPW